MSNLTDLTKNQFESLLRKYLVDHSSRRLNFLYWNISDHKDQLLNFVNITGKDLNRVNNVDLVYRLLKIKNENDYSLIRTFLQEYVIDPAFHKSVYVIRIDFLMSYLKSIKFDLSQFTITHEAFHVGYCNVNDESKKRPICIIDDDVQSLYLISRLSTKYRQFVFQNDIQNAVITDIKTAYIETSDYVYSIDQDASNINVPLQDGLDAVAKKFISSMGETRLEQIYMAEDISTVSNKFVCQDMTIVTVRVYLHLFFKRFTKKD